MTAQDPTSARSGAKRDRAMIVLGVIVAIFCLTPWELMLR